MPTSTLVQTDAALIPEGVEPPSAFEDARRSVTHAEVARRAYEIFQMRGEAPGGEIDDWLQAERELTGK
jgi:hypothetical protein